MIKRLFASILLATFFLGIMARFAPAYAQAPNPWYNQSFEEWQAKVFDETNQDIFGERYTYAQVVWIVHSLTAIVTGSDIIKCAQMIGDATNFQNCMNSIRANPLSPGASINSSPIFFLASVGNTMLNTHPASGINYLAEKARDFSIIPQAYAQGFGFQTLEPIQNLWKVSRNFAYALLIIVMIIVAFMIMLRTKTSPQTVISVQSVLPKIALAIVFIAFSYPIAGLMIDLSYVIVGALALFVNSVGGLSSLGSIEFFQQAIAGNGLVSIYLGIVVLLLTVGTVSTILLPGFGGILALPTLLILLFIGIIVLWSAIKIIVLLVSTFINIVLLIIAGPFMILLGILPGGFGFGQWIRSLMANIAVYPVVILMTFLAHYFFWGVAQLAQTIANAVVFGIPLNTFQISPVANNVSNSVVALPNFQGSVQVAGFITAIGLLFLLSNAANMIKATLMGKPFDFETAIGRSVSIDPRSRTGQFQAQAGKIFAEKATRMTAMGRGITSRI